MGSVIFIVGHIIAIDHGIVSLCIGSRFVFVFGGKQNFCVPRICIVPVVRHVEYTNNCHTLVAFAGIDTHSNWQVKLYPARDSV